MEEKKIHLARTIPCFQSKKEYVVITSVIQKDNDLCISMVAQIDNSHSSRSLFLSSVNEHFNRVKKTRLIYIHYSLYERIMIFSYLSLRPYFIPCC